jgi:hypothetical protein
MVLPTTEEDIMTASRGPFRGARKAKRTLKHRPAVWEMMLGTVYASNGKETRYFDYDWDAAREFAGIREDEDQDLRLDKWPAHTSLRGNYTDPRTGQLVLFVRV